MNTSSPHLTSSPHFRHLPGKRVAVVVFSHYPSDPRPKRAAEALASEGMKVSVISLMKNGHEPLHETVNGVQVLRIPFRHWRGGALGYLVQYGLFIAIVFVLLSMASIARRFSLVHVHNMPDVLVFAAAIPKLFGARVVLDMHDPMPELMRTIFHLNEDSKGVRLLRMIEKWSLGFADKVLTVNEGCKRLFSGRSCSPEKISVVMNSPDEAVFRFVESSPDHTSTANTARPFAIMYHGSLVERNGLDLAVSALGLLRESVPGAVLRIYGRRTPFLDQIMKSVERTENRGAVKYLGERSLEQIVEAIRMCDVGVVPNRRNLFTEINTPTRIFEYLSQGKPVIAPAAPGIQDYFGPDELVYFELGNVKDLAERLRQVFLCREETARIVANGQRVYRKHNWQGERITFLEVVGSLLAPKPVFRAEAPKGACSRAGYRA